MTYSTISGWLKTSLLVADKPVNLNNFQENCVPFNSVASINQVIIRIDDVQAFAYRDVTKKIINSSILKKVPVVIGVIPKYISTDNVLTEFIRKNICNLEIALHGWDHLLKIVGKEEISEFEKMDEADASVRLNKGIDEIEKTFGVNVSTFIPPENKISEEGIKAVKKANIKNISKSGNGILDFSVTTYEYENKRSVPAQQIIETCEIKIINKGLCVILVHPQDFLTDENIDVKKFEEYTKLLNLISSKGWQATTFRDLTLFQN